MAVKTVLAVVGVAAVAVAGVWGLFGVAGYGNPMVAPTPTVTPVPSVADRLDALESRPVTATPTATPEPTPTATPKPTPTATPKPTPTAVLEPNQRHLNEKRYMLALINEVRVVAGVPAVELGNNPAAQLHAEASLAACISSHWGLDGLTPNMRYSLAGGYQSSSENALGSDYCITEADGYRQIDVAEKIEEGMDAWMGSAGHRRTILNRHYRKVNIGLAWDRWNFRAVQQFEGDYVQYERLPQLDADGRLLLEGETKNGAKFGYEGFIDVVIHRRPTPYPLSAGQISMVYGYCHGPPVAFLRRPPSPGHHYKEDWKEFGYQPCPDPYAVNADHPPPASRDEARQRWEAAKTASERLGKQSVIVDGVTASRWEVSGERFLVEALIGPVLDEQGPGVYAVVVWGTLGEERVIISEYSIFQQND